MVEYAILIGVLSMGVVTVFSLAQTTLFEAVNNGAAAIEAAIN
ncbi:hypothetical protein [Phenylobacterium sp.]